MRRLSCNMEMALAAAPLVRTRYGFASAAPDADPRDAHHPMTIAVLVRRKALVFDPLRLVLCLPAQPQPQPGDPS